MSTEKQLTQRLQQTLKCEILAVTRIQNEIVNITKAISVLSKRKGKIVVTGVGKSAFIGMKMAATLTSLGHFATFLHPVDALHGDLGSVHSKDVLIAFSYSGESKEVLRVVEYLKSKNKIQIISITKSHQSSVGKHSDVHVAISIDKEGSPKNLAPMASTTASLVVADVIACGLVVEEKFTEDHFARFHPGGNLGLRLKKVGDLMHKGKAVPVIADNKVLTAGIVELDKKKKGVVGIVNEKKQIIGVISDGDIRRFFVTNTNIKGVLVKDIMSINPKTILKDDSLKLAIDTMEKWKITSLFVTDSEKRPVGIIHIHDIVETYVS